MAPPRPLPRRSAVVAGLVLCLGAGAVTASAQSAAPQDWTARKCDLYGRAWQHVSAGGDLTGVGPDFSAAHDDFLASGCTRRAVCPRTAREISLADLLSLMAVAEGMAGSFLPFTCAPATPGGPR